MLIDTDMGSDDAVALIMALRHPDIDVKAITTVYGNVSLPQAVRNALIVTELCDATVPVYRGVEKPLIRPFEDATWFHGSDGLGDVGIADPKGTPTQGHAVDAIIETVLANPGIMIVTLGPLTNVALAVQRAPEIIENVSRCVVMGGAACTYGNVTPAAEWNIWCDPEAARMVFLSGMRVEMVGWEFCIDNHALNADEMQAIRDIGTPIATFALDCNRVAIEAFREQTGLADALSLPDPVTMAIAIDPTIATQMSAHYVEVITQGELTRGMTLVDKLDVAEDPRNRVSWADAIARGNKVHVTWEVDIPRWKALLMECLS
jgi:purine nucleosidase